MICQCSCNFNIFSAELEELDPKIVDDAYDQLGPIPRLCLRTAFDPQNLKMYKDDLHRIAKHMTLQSLEELLRKVMNWNMDDVSRKVCLIKRPKKNNVRHFFRVQPITDNVQSKIAISLRDLDGRQQIASYRSFAHIPRLKGMTGPLFEGFCHGRFQKSIFIHCIPMVCLDKKEWKDQPQWYSSHSPIQNQALEASHQDALHCRATLDVCPSHTCEYTDKDLPELDPEEDVYYVPTTENVVPLGSFILHGDRLYMFQFTCYDAHDIKAGLISRFAGFTRFPPPDKWHFIFVIPNDIKVFKCTYQRTPELQGLKLFSAQVAMDDAQGQVVPPGSSKRRSPPSIKEGKEEHPPKRSKVTLGICERFVS